MTCNLLATYAWDSPLFNLNSFILSLKMINQLLKNLYIYYLGIKEMFTNDGEWDKKSFIIERIDAKNIENYFQF